MTQAQFGQLLTQLGSGHVTAFFLVLARVAPLFVLAPLFSSRLLPGRVRGIVAVALTVGLTPMAAHGQHIPTQPLEVAGLMISGMLVGLAFALAVGALFAAVQTAGTLVDAMAGFSFGQMVDPINGNNGGVMSQLYGVVGITMFIAIGGDAWMLRGLSRTFDLVPLTRAPQIGSLVEGAAQNVASILVGAIEIAAPAMLALIITDIAFGVVSRVVPQLNVFAVGFPFKTGVTLLIVAASLPFMGSWLSDQVISYVGTALHSLRIA